MATAPKAVPSTASLMVNVFDGTRQPISAAVELLIRVTDGNRNSVSSGFHKGPSVRFTGLPFHDNLGDNYTVLVSADRHVQAGVTPVKISPRILQSVDLMLLPENGNFNFRAARWATLKKTRPKLVQLLSHGGGARARDRYAQLMEKRPASLAALLNITTAMESIFLPVGTPMDYLVELIWDDTMQPDRFFAYAGRALLDQVRLAAEQNVFKADPNPDLLHPGATSSYKQVRFGEANVQLTFHENNTRELDGVSCVKVEADIDYYADLAAHALLEVLPNAFLGTLTDPKMVCALRWIAGRRAGLPEFDPPYTIEA